MTRIVLSRSPWWAATALVLTMGCGTGPSGRPADPAQAQQALCAALDVWQGGGQPADLAQRSPSIHVSDVDWRDGLRLERYEAAATARPDGFDLSYPVTLELKTGKGKSIKKKAIYLVSTSPQIAIVRVEN